MPRGGSGGGGSSRGGRGFHRGRHNYGGHRGGGRGGGGGGQSSSSSNAQFESDRPPPHLRGREIGLWYAARGKKKDTKADLPSVEINETSKAKITTLVEQLENLMPKSTENSQESEFQKRYKQNLFDNASNALSTVAGINNDVNSGTKIARNPSLDEALKADLEMKQNSQKYKNMQTFRMNLPAYKHKEEFLKLVAENQVIVVSGETGCGKTTQCCQLILDEMITSGNGSMCNIVCTQPRRISAISVAQRVSEERDENIGQSVGYSIRLEARYPSNSQGSILFCTTGVIFQYLKEDPCLSKFSHIIVDEIHERGVNEDFLITILKDIMKIRPDLKVILMSATINAEQFSRYFNHCPCFNIPGFTFPVEALYLEDVLQRTRFVFETEDEKGNHHHNNRRGRFQKHGDDDSEYEKTLESYLRDIRRKNSYSHSVIKELEKPEAGKLNLDLIESLLSYICTTDNANGAVLIFVPGWDQISKLNTQLQHSGRYPVSRFLIIPLHSLMPTVNQKEVFNRPSGGRRKIVIATNIAETSITIDDIVHVIDAGKIKLTNFDIKRNIESLDTEWVSLANATQRRGRSGRVQAGVCYHLFNRARLLCLESFKKPEILRKRLDEVVLQIKVLRLGTANTFLSRLMDPPSAKSVELAVQRLIEIHALDSEENLTPLGFHLAHLPMDPQTGKMILMAGVFGCVDPVTTIAASLSFKDPFYIPLGKERDVDRVRLDMSRGTNSDHLVTVYALEGYRQACQTKRERDYCYRNYLSLNTLQLLENMKNQFTQHLFDMKFVSSPNCTDEANNINSDNMALVKAIIVSGLYPNVANVRVGRRGFGGNSFPRVRTFEDGKVDIHPKSVNTQLTTDVKHGFLVYFEKMKSTSIFLYDTTMVDPFPLIFFGGRLRYQTEKGIGTVVVDSRVDLRIDKPTFEIIQNLRKHFDKLLEEKVNNPAPTCWNALSKEGALLRAITGIITAESRQMLGDYSDSDD